MNPRVLLVVAVLTVVVVLIFLGLQNGSDSVEDDAGPAKTTVIETTTTN
jgi:hypothetical protein